MKPLDFTNIGLKMVQKIYQEEGGQNNSLKVIQNLNNDFPLHAAALSREKLEHSFHANVESDIRTRASMFGDGNRYGCSMCVCIF